MTLIWLLSNCKAGVGLSRFEQIIGFEKDLNSNSKWINKAFRWKNITAFWIKKTKTLENQRSGSTDKCSDSMIKETYYIPDQLSSKGRSWIRVQLKHISRDCYSCVNDVHGGRAILLESATTTNHRHLNWHTEMKYLPWKQVYCSGSHLLTKTNCS